MDPPPGTLSATPPGPPSQPTVFRLRPMFVIVAAFILVVVGGGVTLLTLASKGAFDAQTVSSQSNVPSADASAEPSASAAAPAPGSTTSTGTHVLAQQDSTCNFTDAPRVTGTMTITVEPDGAASGTIKGKGNGVRAGVVCGASTATLIWNQDYTLTFTGRVSSGKLQASGNLTTNNRTTLSSCTTNGAPVACPPYPAASGPFAMSLSGSYSTTSEAGNGTIAGGGFGLPGGAKPISGTWNVS